MNIRDRSKKQLRRRVEDLWQEDDRLLEPYDCGRELAEHIGPPRIREIRLELEAINDECGRRLAMEAAGEEYDEQQAQ